MKKVYNLLAAISLSLLTIGAVAQTPGRGTMGQKPSKGRTLNSVRKNNPGAKRAQGGFTNALIDYSNGDQAVGLTLNYWVPPAYINMRYTIADTTFSPYTSAAANADLMNYITVAYDTLWDVYSQSFITPTAGPFYVDTIWTYMSYANASGTNDTVVFQVCAVNAKGFPTSTIYGSDTVILNASSFTYNAVDSVQIAYFIPTTSILIPSTARHGWNYCITMKNFGSKLDTVGVFYFSQADQSCGVTDAFTYMGVPDGHAPTVNSFVTGEYWYNDAKNMGNGTQMTWPTFTGKYPGYCINSAGYYWYDQLYSGCTDTARFPEQDLGIFASVAPVPVGIANITDNGLSVGQNFPNPYNKTTQISYSLTKSSDVVFSVCDIAGRELINTSYKNAAPGQHVISLNANEFTSGVYFYTFKVNGNAVTKKMVITE